MSGGTDLHQHLWPEPLLAALARRRSTPLLRADRHGGWLLRIDGEPEWPVDPRDHDPVRRAALVAADGLDRAVVALSSPLGIEALAADEAAGLVEAYHDGARTLPRSLRAWASAGLAEPDPAALAATLRDGLVGLVLPAGALSGPVGVARCAPLLDVLERRGAPLLVHPGPAPWTTADAAPEAGLPMWWPAMTSYVSQMQTAWLAFRTWVRPAHPGLRVCFAMLAGLAPLQAGRLRSRGADDDVRDPLTVYDTSSYGPGAVAAMAEAVGADALVHGSDRPVVAPGASDDPLIPLRAANGTRFLAPLEVPA